MPLILAPYPLPLTRRQPPVIRHPPSVICHPSSVVNSLRLLPNVSNHAGYKHGKDHETSKYVAEGDLVTPSGIRAQICTVWIVETGENIPRFVTAYPTHKEDTGVESD